MFKTLLLLIGTIKKSFLPDLETVRKESQVPVRRDELWTTYNAPQQTTASKEERDLTPYLNETKDYIENDVPCDIKMPGAVLKENLGVN